MPHDYSDCRTNACISSLNATPKSVIKLATRISPVDEIRKLATLRDEGITSDEFEAKKRELLNLR